MRVDVHPLLVRPFHHIRRPADKRWSNHSCLPSPSVNPVFSFSIPLMDLRVPNRILTLLSPSTHRAETNGGNSADRGERGGALCRRVRGE